MTLTNLFIIINLGCEMLYVIDQRLKAQNISLDKSAQVLRDITEVLLDPKFLHYIATAYHQNILTIQQTRILLTDIACCSLMRLDVNSMDKLWDLMIMILKWQLYLIQDNVQLLMNVTFKHLDGIGKLIPEMRKQILIDAVKKYLIDNWENLTEDEQIIVYKKIAKWLRPFNTKISILIRMGLQKTDGEFEKSPANNIFYNYYINNVGENIYSRTANLSALKAYSDNKKIDKKLKQAQADVPNSHEIDTLFEQLNIHHLVPESSSQNVKLNNEVIQSGLNDIQVDSNILPESDEKPTESETNLSKFMKKLKMENHSVQASILENEFNPNEELLKMFDQDL